MTLPVLNVYKASSDGASLSVVTRWKFEPIRIKFLFL